MGLPELWEVWEVKFLLLLSLLVQVLLLIFTELRRRIKWTLLSAPLNGILWLLYQLADSIGIYVLGHMSLSSKPREQQQLMAFWAPLLLVHLGGQDTITAYAMEDNELWLRHLFTLTVQAGGAAYVLYKYAIGGGALLAAAVLMFLVGVAKYGERIYALRSSSHENMTKFLVGASIRDSSDRYRNNIWSLDDAVAAEDTLQGAHDLLYICMGQFVDYKVWPSGSQVEALELYHREGRLWEMVGMQLSLMHDLLYTKTAVIFTWYGCCIRAVSTVSTIVALYLFHSSAGGMGGVNAYSRVDMVVTYILLAGALLLEMASVLRLAVSTWTCAWLRGVERCKLIYKRVISLRRGVKAAGSCRRWSGFIGQYDLAKFCRYSWTISLGHAVDTGLSRWWNRMRRFLYLDSLVISRDTEKLVLEEIQSMVVACEEREDTLWSYRGQRALSRWESFFQDLGCGIDDDGFDGSILAWHLATDVFLHFFKEDEADKPCIEAVRALSNYMVFLFVERPQLLPSPVRRGLYDSFCTESRLERLDSPFEPQMYESIKAGNHLNLPHVLQPGAKLAEVLLRKSESDMPGGLKVILGVWVEMLCYAAHHCGRDSHARQLNSGGGEFITIVWILVTAQFNHHYGRQSFFQRAMSDFFEKHWRAQQWRL